jgi:16S rRNA (uracil1498-N3)-methyltransferase
VAHFYLDETLQAGDSRPGALVTVRGSEAKHAVTVSRVRPGEQLLLGNGAGLTVTGTVVSAESGELTLEVTEATMAEAPAPRIHLVQALAKGDRDELAVQAATELGVDGVIPWAAARSVSRWDGAKIAKGRDRWAAIVREATKQSIRPWLPEVGELTSTKSLATRAAGSRMLVLEPTAEVRLTEIEFGTRSPGRNSDNGVPDGRDILLVVGPEGGIAPAELDQLQQAGATPVRLGNTVLRTSTAGPAALVILNQALGRW